MVSLVTFSLGAAAGFIWGFAYGRACEREKTPYGATRWRR